MAEKKFEESKAGGVICLILIIVIIATLVYVIFFSGENSTSSDNSFLDKTKVVMQSQKERFGCEDGKIENLTNVESTKSKSGFKIMDGIRTNIVEYPLNKNEVMIEYCFRVANNSSELNGLWLAVKFLDKDKNVLAEEEERVADIPGRRIKTIYGSKIVDVGLANEMTNISVRQE